MRYVIVALGGGVAFLGYRYCLERGGKCGGMILRVKCIAKTVRRVRRRLKNLHVHDLEKYYRSYEAYRGYFAGALPKRKIQEVMKSEYNLWLKK